MVGDPVAVHQYGAHAAVILLYAWCVCVCVCLGGGGGMHKQRNIYIENIRVLSLMAGLKIEGMLK